MILGAGVMQIPAIRIARSKGWRVVAVDANPAAAGGSLADRFETVDLKDKDGLCALGRTLRDEGGLDGVFTAGTDFSSSVAWVAEKLGLPGITYATAMRATDKCLMRAAFAAAGVASPRFACWTGDGDPLLVIHDGLTFPLVVKPVDNMGARGVRRVDDANALGQACMKALELSRSRKVIVEEYMEGPELSLDAVVNRGIVTVCGVADRHISFPPSFVEMGHTMPTSLDSGVVKRIEEVFAAGILAIGIDNGAAKGDIKLTARGPMVGEIAARLSGGYMSGWTFPLASGVEVTAAALNIAVGLPPGDLGPTLRRTCAERALISIPGIVAAVEGESGCRSLPGVEEVFLRVGPGDAVVFPTNNVEKCGNVICVGDDRGEAARRACAALQAVTIRLRPLVDRTTRYLFAEKGNDAFLDVAGAFEARIARMLPYRGVPSTDAEKGPTLVESIEEETVKGSDWYGATMTDAARTALRSGGGQFVREGAASGKAIVLGSLFWRALKRGSTQGATYLLASVREAARTGTLKELLAGL
jgi:biotin carboxylase